MAGFLARATDKYILRYIHPGATPGSNIHDKLSRIFHRQGRLGRKGTPVLIRAGDEIRIKKFRAGLRAPFPFDREYGEFLGAPGTQRWRWVFLAVQLMHCLGLCGLRSLLNLALALRVLALRVLDHPSDAC